MDGSVPVNGMCRDIPKDNTYFLTSFCDQEVACPPYTYDCSLSNREYFAADRQVGACMHISILAKNVILIYNPATELLSSCLG